ncbi:MAG TPA: laccase domain-containing protein, partial [Limnochordia bacterium]|nr:laccase domain-containing protein [Limnochordia bacterium]
MPTFDRFPSLDRLGVPHAFTHRTGGVSTGAYDSLNLGLHVGDDPARVAANRGRVARALGAPLASWVVGEQV